MNSHAWRDRLAPLVITIILALGRTADAQDERGTITGRAADLSGGVMPGVTVTVVNTGTNAAVTVVTNESGQYSALYLVPGVYTLRAELPGFKSFRREAITIRVGDRIVVDVQLEPGNIEEHVTVTAEPVLQLGTATMGQTIDSKLIAEIPLGDGTAYGLTRLIPGASFERSYALQRPMDNDNLRGLSVTGTISSEFSIDGSSNVVSGARVGIQPPAEAIQEFKVDTAVYDAQVGHTGAGSVNLALKSGTNLWSFAASYYNRDDSRSEDLFASIRNNTGKTTREYSRFSFTASGPIVRNKLFFMVSYEGLQDDTEESVTHSVPTELMRKGDFSELLAAGVQIYDPATARNVNSVVVRDPFPGNVIEPDRISPIAARILDFYPRPNKTPNADLTGNYFVDQPWTYGYDLEMARVDYVWSNSGRTYGRWIRNFRREERHDFGGEIGGAQLTRGSTDRFNLNLAVGHTHMLTPSTVLDVKGSWLRFNDDTKPYAPFDPANLGYSSSTLALFRGYQFIPRYSIESGTPTTAGTVATLGSQQGTFNTGRQQPFYNIQFTPTVTWTRGAHTVRTGYDFRRLRQDETNVGWQGGAYAFDSSYTKATSAVEGRYGQGIAAFLLGIPTNNSFIEIRPEQSFAVDSNGLFVHDDWRVSQRLTVNLGLRYDIELGMTEAENRAVRAFDFTTANPIQGQAQAAFAASAPAGVPLSASEFGSKIRGGYAYLSDDQPRMWTADGNNFQPRAGAAYAINARTVLRGGVGLFVAPFQVSGVPGLANPINQFGFSRQTPVPVSSDTGVTFNASLANPVPSGILLEPAGASLGLRANLGGSPNTVFLDERANPEYWRYSIGLEHELPWSMVAEISYLGQRGRHLPYIESVNFVPLEFRSQSDVRDAAAETFLTQTVANPFQGLFPDNPGSNGATIARRRLLLQYPHFDGLTREVYQGSNRYHGLVLRLDKRFQDGFMVMTSYTYSRIREKVAPLNPWEGLEDRISTVDRPHRVTLAAVAEVPFGHGRRWGSTSNEFVNATLGGWQFTARYEQQSGQPLAFGNVYFDSACGNPADAISSTWGDAGNGQLYGVDVPLFDTSCFYTRNGQPFVNASGQVQTFGATEINLPANSSIRRFPTTLDSVRFQQHRILDIGIGKTFAVGARVRMQLRIEALNALNYTLFNVGNVIMDPKMASFGRITNIDSSTVMKPRDIQLGFRVMY
jgi:Carboxypeptidase regulatory-like domain/TonB dependent receptor-like, beta-barrel